MSMPTVADWTCLRHTLRVYAGSGFRAKAIELVLRIEHERYRIVPRYDAAQSGLSCSARCSLNIEPNWRDGRRS